MQISDDCPQLMGNHSSVSTAQVVIEGIMDEGILVLWKDYETTDDRTVLYSQVVMVMPRKLLLAYIHDIEKTFRRIANITGT